MFNGQREGKDIQKYSVPLKNSASVAMRDCKCEPLTVKEAYNSAPENGGGERLTGRPTAQSQLPAGRRG